MRARRDTLTAYTIPNRDGMQERYTKEKSSGVTHVDAVEAEHVVALRDGRVLPPPLTKRAVHLILKIRERKE